MDSYINEQIRRIALARDRVEIERAKLDEAMKERKTYEKLRERAFEEFKADILYREGKETDELIAYTYGTKDTSEE